MRLAPAAARARGRGGGERGQAGGPRGRQEAREALRAERSQAAPPAGGADLHEHGPPQHRAAAAGVRGRDARVPGDGVLLRRVAPQAHAVQGALPRGGGRGRDRPAAARRVLLPQPRRREGVPPRPEARQHPPRPQGDTRGVHRREDIGLRPLEAHRRRLQPRDDPGRDAAVLGAGGLRPAEGRQGVRREGRPLEPGRRPLRDARRQPALRGRQLLQALQEDRRREVPRPRVPHRRRHQPDRPRADRGPRGAHHDRGDLRERVVPGGPAPGAVGDTGARGRRARGPRAVPRPGGRRGHRSGRRPRARDGVGGAARRGRRTNRFHEVLA
mmetsp:Transcript_126408/g.357520  ORF Transcript_126408/g.357520 Transcript_126408/m.357520 type:complete len:328 (+) Transcript_126408:349-1332(+)